MLVSLARPGNPDVSVCVFGQGCSEAQLMCVILGQTRLYFGGNR